MQLAGLGKNDKVNAVEPTMKSRKVVVQLPHTQPSLMKQKELLWFSFSLEALRYGMLFDKKKHKTHIRMFR